MAKPPERAHLCELIDGSGVPHEIESFTRGKAVVDAIVAEVPSCFDVSAWRHAAAGDESIHPFRVEECAMGGVVAKDEHPGDGEAHGQPEEWDRPPLRGQHEQREWSDVED